METQESQDPSQGICTDCRILYYKVELL